MLTMKAFKKNQQKTPSIFREKTNNAAPDCPRSLDLHGINPRGSGLQIPPHSQCKFSRRFFTKSLANIW